MNDQILTEKRVVLWGMCFLEESYKILKLLRVPSYEIWDYIFKAREITMIAKEVVTTGKKPAICSKASNFSLTVILCCDGKLSLYIFCNCI